MSENHTAVINPRHDLGAQAPLETAPAVEVAPAPAAEAIAPTPRRRNLNAPRLNASPTSAVWAGLVVVGLGFVTILFSWIKVAATLDVGRQMPYVVSGAMTGLGLIVVGIAVVDMAVRRQDRIERRQQLSLMRTVLEELREVLEPQDQDTK